MGFQGIAKQLGWKYKAPKRRVLPQLPPEIWRRILYFRRQAMMRDAMIRRYRSSKKRARKPGYHHSMSGWKQKYYRYGPGF